MHLIKTVNGLGPRSVGWGEWEKWRGRGSRPGSESERGEELGSGANGDTDYLSLLHTVKADRTSEVRVCASEINIQNKKKIWARKIKFDLNSVVWVWVSCALICQLSVPTTPCARRKVVLTLWMARTRTWDKVSKAKHFLNRCFSRRVFSIARNPFPFFSIRSLSLEGATCDGKTPPSAVSSLPLSFFSLFATKRPLSTFSPAHQGFGWHHVAFSPQDNEDV